MAEILVDNVYKKFGALEVLKAVNLKVNKGEIFALIGRSGSGKSTLLRCINGLETIDHGEIHVTGHKISNKPADLRKLRMNVGIVFQSYNLFPHLNVTENIALAPRIVKKIRGKELHDITNEVLALVGLTEKASAYPDQLSGGQQQRVAIARSLAMQPKIMLFDEVTSALDPELTEEVLLVMEKLGSEGMTMILVTHEMGFARRMATQTVFMYQGKIWEQGVSEQIFSNPQSPELKNFVKSTLK